MITGRQQEILDYLAAFIAREGFAPTVREITAGVGLTSVSSVHAHLDALERAGRIRRRPGSPRAIRLLEVSA